MHLLVGDDQEETLNKILEILKKVAEIPGTEIAATAFGEQGPEHTIMSWYQETERYCGIFISLCTYTFIFQDAKQLQEGKEKKKVHPEGKLRGWPYLTTPESNM